MGSGGGGEGGGGGGSPPAPSSPSPVAGPPRGGGGGGGTERGRECRFGSMREEVGANKIFGGRVTVSCKAGILWGGHRGGRVWDEGGSIKNNTFRLFNMSFGLDVTVCVNFAREVLSWEGGAWMKVSKVMSRLIISMEGVILFLYRPWDDGRAYR